MEPATWSDDRDLPREKSIFLNRGLGKWKQVKVSEGDKKWREVKLGEVNCGHEQQSKVNWSVDRISEKKSEVKWNGKKFFGAVKGFIILKCLYSCLFF